MTVFCFLLTVSALGAQDKEIPDFSGSWDESRIMNRLFGILVRDIAILDRLAEGESSDSAMAKRIRDEKKKALQDLRTLSETPGITLDGGSDKERMVADEEGPDLLIRMENQDRLWYAFFLGHDLSEDLTSFINTLFVKSFAYETGLRAMMQSGNSQGRGGRRQGDNRSGQDGPPPRQGGFD